MQNSGDRFLFPKLLVLIFCGLILICGIDYRGGQVGEIVYQFVRMVFTFSMANIHFEKTYLFRLSVLICDRKLENIKSIQKVHRYN